MAEMLSHCPKVLVFYSFLVKWELYTITFRFYCFDYIDVCVPVRGEISNGRVSLFGECPSWRLTNP